MTFVRYIAIQLLAYGLDMGSFLVVLYFGLAGPIIANVIAKLIAGCFAFIAHRHFTFSVAKAGIIKRQATLYFLLLAVNVPVASGLLALFLIWIPVPAFAKVVSDIVSLSFTYLLSKYFIFNAHDGSSDSSTSSAKT